MSRIGKLPIVIPSGVTVTVDDSEITVAGSKGTLKTPLLAGLKFAQADGQFIITRINDEAANRARHGLMRTLVYNMVQGVSQGYSKKLEIVGVGFRVAASGNGLKLNLGFSHEINYTLAEGITAAVEQNTLTISGIDKQKVGQAAAEIRSLKKPEPYKGKGIQYAGERVLRKSGKSGKDK
ncbi:MAG: 50S ribosomal protein L6 [Candidatus Saccharimonadales bacterium]